MEVMEDGNLMDKVHILIQRDMEYYNSKQTVLQEIICPGIVGGRLDFPRSASFAAVKLVLWWEEEFVAAYRTGSGFMQEGCEDTEKSMVTSGGCGGIVKASDPEKFISLITKSSDQLLDHLHILTQEALDHADLTVLTGTIGAAALLKNCLWCYIQTSNSTKSVASEGLQLQTSHKKYQEMGEALAERLLDLHCRLLSLYILQDAESLDWENVKPFCESERGSYVVQMWWLYMQGTKEDLWNTVPPKMAQRVFSGMLNESLTIFTVRYSQALSSENRSQLYAVDISNLLLCIANLLPSICNNAEEFTGLNLNSQSKMLRDIHVKCQELLLCLLLRGAPLDILYKAFRKGLDKIELFKPKIISPNPWIIFTMSYLYAEFRKTGYNKSELSVNMALILELSVLLPQPQPNWPLLLKVLCMKDCKLTLLILELALEEYRQINETHGSSLCSKLKCGGFLCSGDGTCKDVDANSLYFTPRHYYDLIYASTYIILCVGNSVEFLGILLPTITKYDDWANCFERRQVWSQKRPAWYEAIIDLINPIIPPIVNAAINAIKTGASMYQACTLILATFINLWECVNPALTVIAMQIQELIPTSIIPLGKSILLHIIISALYSGLINKSEENKQVRFVASSNESESHPSKPTTRQSSVESYDGCYNSDEEIAMAVAEALCSIDEDNKHTTEIEDLIEQAKLCELTEVDRCGSARVGQSTEILEIIVSDFLMISDGKKSLKILQHFIKNNDDWIFQKLDAGKNSQVEIIPNRVAKDTNKLLHTMFYIGNTPFDQLLVGEWKPDWLAVINIPMGLSMERVYSQISSRWEFNNTNSTVDQNSHIITYMNSIFKQ